MLVTPAEVPTPDEPCTPVGLFPAGFWLPNTVVQSNDENRSAYTTTVHDLIAASPGGSGTGVAAELLVQSAIAFATSRGAPNGQVKGMYLSRGTALADLAVSGRKAYADFCATHVIDPVLAAAVTSREPSIVDPNRAWAVDQALTRAYTVAYALRGFGGRDALAWIEVAGEADQPHRPVNVPTAPVPQFDLAVDVPAGTAHDALTVDHVRYAVFPGSIAPVDPAQLMDWIRSRRVPVDPTPVVPTDRDLLVYVHGHSSRLEEACDLAPVLASPPGPDPNGCLRPFTVVSLDLPCNGYTSTVDHEAVAPFPASIFDVLGSVVEGEALLEAVAKNGGQLPVPLLEFLEDFLLAFVVRLGQEVGQDLRGRLAAFIGGSLGGNMALRLAERAAVPPSLDPTGAPGPLWWVGNAVAWSAASTWTPAYDDAIRMLSLKSLSDSVMAPETPDSRGGYFATVFDKPAVELPDVVLPDPLTEIALQALKANVPPPQPQAWYRGGDWQACKDSHVKGSRYERQEMYNERFRRWHWRLALEQMAWSHQYTKDAPVCARARARVLLASGRVDDYEWTNIYSATHQVAQLMWANPGTTLFLQDTGHSIHNERPRRLARAIQEFLPPARPAPGVAEPWTGWTSLGGAVASALAVASQADGRLELVAIDTGGQVVDLTQTAPSGPWSPAWGSLAGSPGDDVHLVGAPAVAPNGDGHLEVVVRSAKDTLHVWQGAPNGSWGGWSAGLIGSPTGGPSVCTKPNGLLLVAVLDDSAHVRIRGQNSLGGWWMDSHALGSATFVGDPLVVAARDGRLVIVVRDGSGAVWRASTPKAGSDDYSDWTSMGGTVSGPLTAVRDSHGMLCLLGRGGDGSLFLAQQQDDAQTWSGWSSLGGTLKDGARPSAARNGWGGLQVAVRWQDDSVKYVRQEPSTGLAWSSWFDLGGTVTGDPVLLAQADGALSVLAVGADSAVWTRSQTSCPPPPPPPPSPQPHRLVEEAPARVQVHLIQH